MKFRLSHHAQVEAERRSIPLAVIESVLANPQQVVPEAPGMKAYQSKHRFGGRMFLVRVIADESVDPPTVVTVYRTSKIDKYWRQQ